MLTNTLTQMLTHAHMPTHAHPCTHAHTHTHTHTHTRAHMCTPNVKTINSRTDLLKKGAIVADILENDLKKKSHTNAIRDRNRTQVLPPMTFLFDNQRLLNRNTSQQKIKNKQLSQKTNHCGLKQQQLTSSFKCQIH